MTLSTRWAIGVVPALVVAVALAVALWPKAVPPAPQVVVMDAAPWGLVTLLQDESGAAVTLPADRHTPFTMMLPPGRYRVVLQGPPPASQSQSVDLQIELAKPARVFRGLQPAQRGRVLCALPRSARSTRSAPRRAGGRRNPARERGEMTMASCRVVPLALVRGRLAGVRRAGVRAGRRVPARHGRARRQEVGGCGDGDANRHRQRFEGVDAKGSWQGRDSSSNPAGRRRIPALLPPRRGAPQHE